MKKILSSLTYIFLFQICYGQAPQKMSYQAVIRNSANELVVNLPIGIKISILKDSEIGEAVYTETHTTTTNANGLASIDIGAGTPITGTFPAINWSTGTYFVKTETDPTGGTNYDIVGVGQILSVPYALYAENSKHQGKTTIILTGDITDEEAAAQIEEEAGPNTENVIITNTTELTTVNLSLITKLLNFEISNNPMLVSVNIENLEKVYKDFIVNYNEVLTNLNFNSLTFFPNKLEIDQNSSITSILFPSLTKIRPNSSLKIAGNTSLNSLSFPILEKTEKSSITIESNIFLTAIETPLLTKLGQLNISNNALLTNLNVSNIESIEGMNIQDNAITSLQFSALTNGSITINEVNLTSINCSLLTTGGLQINNSKIISIDIPILTNGFIVLQYNSLLQSINLPLLVSSYIDITSNSIIQSINFPSLLSLSRINVTDNPLLETLSFSNFTNYTNPNVNSELRFSNNKFSSGAVNSILNKLVNATFDKNVIIVLANQTPPAPPTDQGLVDKQTLIDAGNSVITD